MTERRVLVCGGRTFDDVDLLNSTLDALHNARPIDELIHGDCTGADLMAEGWASSCCVSVSAFPANWADQGKAAGPIRNERMLREGKPTLVVAFQEAEAQKIWLLKPSNTAFRLGGLSDDDR